MAMNQSAYRDMMSGIRGEAKAEKLDWEEPPQFGRSCGSNLRIALLGRPNAGCSTLFNALCGRRAAASGFPGEGAQPNHGRCPHATDAFGALLEAYKPHRKRPVTYSLVDAPSRNALDIIPDGYDWEEQAKERVIHEARLEAHRKIVERAVEKEEDAARAQQHGERIPEPMSREETDAKAKAQAQVAEEAAWLAAHDEAQRTAKASLEGLWRGAAGADVVCAVVRDFRTGDVTHVGSTVDAARDLRWVAEVAKQRDIVVLKKRVEELKTQRAGNWLRGEREFLAYAVKVLVHGPDPPRREESDGLSDSEDEAVSIDPDDPRFLPRLALRAERWSDDEVAWLSSLDLLTTKPWVVVVNGDTRHFLMGYEDPAVFQAIGAVCADLNVSKVIPCSAIFERKLQDLKDAPTLAPAEEHIEAVSPYDAYVAANPHHASARHALFENCRDALQLVCVYACCDAEVRGFYCRDGCTIREYCVGLHEVVGRNFDFAEVCDAEMFIQLKSEEAVRRAGNVRRCGGDMILEHEQVVFVSFGLPQDAGLARVAWACEARGKVGRKISENARYTFEYDAQFADAPSHLLAAAEICVEDFLVDDAFDSGASSGGEG